MSVSWSTTSLGCICVLLGGYWTKLKPDELPGQLLAEEDSAHVQVEADASAKPSDQDLSKKAHQESLLEYAELSSRKWSDGYTHSWQDDLFNLGSEAVPDMLPFRPQTVWALLCAFVVDLLLIVPVVRCFRWCKKRRHNSSDQLAQPAVCQKQDRNRRTSTRSSRRTSLSKSQRASEADVNHDDAMVTADEGEPASDSSTTAAPESKADQSAHESSRAGTSDKALAAARERKSPVHQLPGAPSPRRLSLSRVLRPSRGLIKSPSQSPNKKSVSSRWKEVRRSLSFASSALDREGSQKENALQPELTYSATEPDAKVSSRTCRRGTKDLANVLRQRAAVCQEFASAPKQTKANVVAEEKKEFGFLAKVAADENAHRSSRDFELKRSRRTNKDLKELMVKRKDLAEGMNER